MTVKRWAFNVTKWQPTDKEISWLCDLLPPAERERIQRFRFPIDSHRALIGQLLSRVAVLSFLPEGVRWNDVDIRRTEYQKPYLASPQIPDLLFNISHHGDYVVVAAGYAIHLGVDVSRVEKPDNESIEEYFAIFKSYFTHREWEYINDLTSGNRDEERLHRFCQQWCLKESYVKALGVGLGLELERIEFRLSNSKRLSDERVQAVDNDIVVLQDGKLQKEFKFELSYVDPLHPVALCYAANETAAVPDRQSLSATDGASRFFRVMSWDEIEALIRQAQKP
ncbi:uncharacterized protein SPPG_08877 [Spizellomyces punctatus DAOM BR117]|uniref:holo-[acyl-carrier-protein] synthase n=1 Tax=Spizellomyces punctatus (strain DAOM BR117) TaxID=645134 RepID=A0A0L0HUX0_SPIPD|nr:uncharacterized protein SPPG_08877 [Spizellomyces punctatus DAOM BR117]KND05136.1 hypothetical protein SPPG_08877 [Spizellomyces punctatus DAOM BR117]|eukprot:XP_016613175.1 hypothetical protein SPPG_08877 [Spizellomyces punctatus DAOM BR117]